MEEDPVSRDAESRVCAVRALGAVACKLCTPHGGAPQPGMRLLLIAVYRALLLAMEDFTADSRYVATARVSACTMNALLSTCRAIPITFCHVPAPHVKTCDQTSHVTTWGTSCSCSGLCAAR